MNKLVCLLLATIYLNTVFAQEYTWNKNATKDNCHCYTLTQDVNNQSGSVWNNNKIDLTLPFDFKFDIYLGCNDNNGADGIAFVLQPISTSVGGQGGGMGYSGVPTSVGVTLDDFQNSGDNDPAYDHIDIQFNGNVKHLITPPRIIATTDNAEDCQWHTLRVKWEPVIKKLTVYFDDVERISSSSDIINDIFHGDSKVFWGFTGATGGSRNLQRFCTALTPGVSFLPQQKKCVGEEVKFFDTTRSFSPVKSWLWNFGDGITSTDQNPIHTYSVVKEYDVTLQVEGADLCIEQITQKVKIGDFPVADFNANDACFDAAVSFIDRSSVTIGTINKWNWDINGSASAIQSPSNTFSQFKEGASLPVKLSVETDLGCASAVTEKSIKIFAQPVADFLAAGGCNNGNFTFSDASKFPANNPDLNGTINAWSWNFGGGKISSEKDPVVILNTTVNPTASLQVTSSNGCKSIVVSKPVSSSGKPIASFSNDIICPSKPARFFDESVSADGSAISKWWWDLDKGNLATEKDPTTSYASPGTINVRLAVETTNGCASDTIEKAITIISGPAADFIINDPLCENAMISFADHSLSSSGNIQSWTWSFDNGKTSAVPDPLVGFSAGDHSASLLVKDAVGCGSSSISKNFTVNTRSGIDFLYTGGCRNSPVVFSGIKNSGTAINEWKWDFGDKASGDGQNPEHTYKENDLYDIQLYGIDANGCYSDTIKRPIDIRGASVFAGNDIPATFNQPVQLHATINSIGPVIYEWIPSSGLDNTATPSPVARLMDNQTYTVRATTADGCVSEDQVTVKIYKGPEIYVPSAFSPNGDGKNDLLKAIPAGITFFENFSIYNRFGQLIFSTTDYTKGWDGKISGDAQNTGVYVWIANGIDYRGNKISRKGTVTIVR